MQNSSRPDTPCVAVCSTTFDEVANWATMSDKEKERVWVRIAAEGYPRWQS